jgi:GR25 family glycosyltransferase involved in LPS biosynthesis
MQNVAIITIPIAPERKQAMYHQMETHSVNLVKWVEGFMPSDIPEFERDFWFNSAEQKAIALSHLAAIQSTRDSWFILEDDVQLATNFMQLFDTFLEAVPQNWDCLYLGFTPIDPHSIYEVHNGYAKLTSDCMGAWAYCIRGNARKEFANLLTKMSADTALEQLQRKYAFYSAFPFIATVKDGYSYNSRMESKWPTIQTNFIDNQINNN